MTATFRLTLAQLNPTVGALAQNAALALQAWQEGRAAGAHMVALTEMFITGYQTQDLVTKPAFTRAAMDQIHSLAKQCQDGPALGIGGPYLAENGKLYNGYFVLQGGEIVAKVLKHNLPNTGVFDEQRIFTSAPLQGPYALGPLRIGTPICEDAWHPEVAETLAETGAQILLVPNGSPYHRGKQDLRYNLMVARVTETGLPLVYLNMVGGQDDQVFDGASFVLNPGGALAAQMPQFETCITHIDFVETAQGWRALEGPRAHLPDTYAADYTAMTLSLRDYMAKTGFKKAVLGLSGGVDSALVAAIAADALGPENLRCVMLPSRYTSPASLADAAAIARALGCALDEISITGPQDAALQALAPLFAGTPEGLTEENLQSRLRGLLLMALSNKFGEMLLTTGNKSEMAVGYCTIYGDMNGGYNPLKDLYKTRVFEMCRWRNAHHLPMMRGPAGVVISPSVIDKPPSAELRENQRDDDSLPPYPVLDAILEGLIDHDCSVQDLVAKGYDAAVIAKIEHLLYISEYKRNQSPPGTRLSPRAFGTDRRYPIAMRWREGS
jgi:NAD+ synthase